jgi:anti-sigma regulatory factor (Ser/Thr protein kinase)
MSPLTEMAVFAAVPSAAHKARAFTVRVLGAWHLSHAADTAALLVSELITNAIAHAGGVLELEPPGDADAAPVVLGLSLRESLRICVWDQSRTPPVRRVAGDDAESGRGLELVDLLSKEWGCDVLTMGGKLVWTVLDVERT